MRARYDEIRALGGEVIVVSFEPASRLSMYIEDHGWPWQVVADPERAGYAAFGLTSATWGAMLRPRVMVKFIQLLRRGLKLRRPSPHVDVLQLGGDFVLDGDRRVVFAHRSTDPADRPPVEALTTALRKLAGSGPAPTSAPPASERPAAT